MLEETWYTNIFIPFCYLCPYHIFQEVKLQGKMEVKFLDFFRNVHIVSEKGWTS